MKMTLRWYGEKDSIPLSYIRQIPGVCGIVTAVSGVPAGERWSAQSVSRLRDLAAGQDLNMEVIESVPVHEDIKLGKPSRDGYIEAYADNIRLLAGYGVKCVCYNFMPVFDWLRTNLRFPSEDGSFSLAFISGEADRLDRKNLRLPGWDESYTASRLSALLEEYKGLSHSRLFDHLAYFLRRLIPVCEACGVDMAIHPDDPPWDVFGLPRIITDEASLDALFSAVPSRHNGLTFCTGSLGANRNNDLPAMAYKYASAGRIPFAHLRNIKYLEGSGFAETAHLSSAGSLDMNAIVSGLIKGGFTGYVRPDHGRSIWGEDGKPGYGLYDRALGAAYLNGLFEANRAVCITSGK